MKYLILAIIYLAATTVSCNKSDSNMAIPNGTYVGTFQRLTNNAGLISNVTLTFSGGNWTGQSQYAKYPALCNGSYATNGTAVTFKNLCVWTAEFDWSLILSSDYQYKLSGSSLQITRNTNLYQDIYKLTKL